MALTSLIIVTSVHIIAGATGTYLINTKHENVAAKNNWLKFLSYFIIFVLISSSVIISRTLFLGIWMIIATLSLIEILKVHKLSERNSNDDMILFRALAVFSVVAVAFSLFVLLPAGIIIYAYSIVVFFDGSSQIAGKLFGKHRILPFISPDKTIEGSIGGLISALISSFFIRDLVHFSALQSVIFGTLVCLAAFTGDMTASAYKRYFRIKDFSNILPGQGGILDRFDSFLMAGSLTGILGISYILDIKAFSTDTALFLGFSLVNISILMICEIAGKKLKFLPEHTRMASHISIGISSLVFLPHFSSPWYGVAFCIQSMAFTFITRHAGVLDSHHGVERNTNGSTYFYCGILVAYLACILTGNKGLFIIPVAILAFSDPAASVAGQNSRSVHWPNLFNRQLRSKKTIGGSVAFLTVTLFIMLSGLGLYYPLPLVRSLIVTALIAIMTTTAEAVSSDGADNLTVPAVASGLLILTDLIFS